MERARAILVEDQVLRLSPHAVLQLENALEGEARVVPQLAELLRRVRGGNANPADVTTNGVDAITS